MMIQSGRKRRGDVLLALNPARIGVLAGASLGIVVLTFVLGFYLGRASGNSEPRGEAAAAAPAVPAVAVATEAEPAASSAKSIDSPSAAPSERSTSPAGAPPPTIITPRTSSAPAAAAPANVGRRYAIIAGSVPIGSDAAAAKDEADKRVNELRVKGFRDARAERVEIPGKGFFWRVVATEATYPSINAALRDIEAMKRRGELSTGWPMKLGDAR